ncbi:MAG: hypothetical protein IMF12_08250 [Proteobacteria bacterium]|nr:hypothetical protein [Pseudomonadota bacterium]
MKIIKIVWVVIISIALFACSLAVRQEENIISLQKEVQLTLNKVNTRLENNPESVLKNSVSTLDSILEYTKTVKSDPSKFSQEKIQAYILKINIINENMERFSDLTLQTDVSFSLGTYKLKDLSKKGKKKILELADKINSSALEMIAKYPEKPIRIIIKTIGYTDETGIVAGGILEQTIMKTISHTIENNPSKKRKQYNQILSEFRASTLNQYVIQHLQQLSNINTLEIVTEILGLGEKFPSTTESNYKSMDPRRRICIISPFIEIIP